MRRLNLGILAHVDAGKTTLTERLLYAAGVIDQLGSVDAGTTQTDSLDLERQRGITIKAAVVSFELAGLTVNLIDTPGHPDFIAEVERSLAVLDGAVLVVSAVEGVQPQTRILMRALRRLGIPTLIFINKIDRVGADPDRVVAQLTERLNARVVVLTSAMAVGSKRAAVYGQDPHEPAFQEHLAEVLAESDEAILGALVDGRRPGRGQLASALVTQAGQGTIHPVLFGSALSGVGTDELFSAIAGLLPSAGGSEEDELSAQVFKIERGRAREKVCYLRVFSGQISVRDHIATGDQNQRVTGLEAFGTGSVAAVPRLVAGQIGRAWGLNRARIGDWLGTEGGTSGNCFAPPSLEAVVVPGPGSDRVALNLALSQMTEQDPLINLRQDERAGVTHVSLYGEVQKEVIGQTLARDFGLEVDFEETTPICVERPLGTGSAAEMIRQPGNPFLAAVGLRIQPAPVGSGLAYRLEVELGALPYAFHKAIEDSVLRTLAQGLHGWELVDAVVSLTHTGYWPRQSAAHQGFDKASSSTGYDFRSLTPLVAVAALRKAATVVCEPIHSLHLEAPERALPGLLSALSHFEVVTHNLEMTASSLALEGEIAARHVHQLSVRLPDLTGGEGVLETEFARYRPVTGAPPTRPRTDDNPLDRKEYLLRMTRRI